MNINKKKLYSNKNRHNNTNNNSNNSNINSNNNNNTNSNNNLNIQILAFFDGDGESRSTNCMSTLEPCCFYGRKTFSCSTYPLALFIIYFFIFYFFKQTFLPVVNVFLWMNEWSVRWIKDRAVFRNCWIWTAQIDNHPGPMLMVYRGL